MCQRTRPGRRQHEDLCDAHHTPSPLDFPHAALVDRLLLGRPMDIGSEKAIYETDLIDEKQSESGADDSRDRG